MTAPRPTPAEGTQFGGKVGIVTGASTGIGRTVALQLAARGCATVCAARSASGLDDVVGEINAADGTALAVPTDVTDDDAVRRLVDRAVAAFGRLDVAYNNAGVPGHGTVRTTDLATFDRVMQVNVRGVFSCLRHEIEAMVSSGAGGAIVNCASAAGHRGVPNKVSYATSKWAVVGMSRSVALDHADDGIRVNVVSPGAVMTPLLAGVQSEQSRTVIERSTPMRRIADPTECAAAVLWLLSPEASFVTGAVLNVDGGVSAGWAADAGLRR